jgi:large subunit ribosomal protein L21
MYADIESGGKQYRVELGSEIQVDRLDVQPGDNINLERVLLVADGDATTVGRPIVDGATVSAEVLRQERGAKVVVFKYKPKARTRVKKGARAELTTLRIADISFAGKSAAKDATAAEAQKAKADREAEKAAAEKAAADQALAAQLATKTTAPVDADAPASRAGASKARKAKVSDAAAPAITETEAAPATAEPETTPATTGTEAAPATAEPEATVTTEPEEVAPESDAETVVDAADETRKDD